MTASPPLNAPLLFADLVDLLRRQGFPIGVDHYVRLYALLDRVGDSTEPSQLKTLLCPIFATSREQQELFYAAFEQCFDVFEVGRPQRANGASDLGPIPGSGRSAAAEKHAPSRWRALIGTAARTTALRVTVYALILILDFGLLVARFALAPDEPGRDLPGRAAGQPTAAVSPDSSTQATASQRAPSPDRLERITQGSRSEPGSARTPSSLFLDVWPFLPLIGIAAFELYRYRRRRPSLRVDHWQKPPFVWQVRVPGVLNPFLRVDELRSVARSLRRRAPAAAMSLDVERTIAATIALLGFPTFHHRSATRPSEYLVLVERAAFRDHQAALFNSLVAALDHEGVLTTRYYYDHDPRTCYREVGETSLLLSDLQRKHHGQHLILFGTGDHLLDPISGAPHPWMELLEAWPNRALLTPEPVDNWSLREITLARSFVVLPATLAGLGEVRNAFDRESGSGDRAVMETSLPETALDAVTASRRDTAVASARSDLGEDAFQWLSACAVYPELHWDLTLHLSTLPELGPRVRTETNLLRLARLPWFRDGSIPADIRETLVRDLDPSLARASRLAVIDLLERNPPPHDSAAMREYKLQLAVQRLFVTPRDRQRRRELLAATRTAPLEHVRRNLVFVRLLDSEKAAASTVILPWRLRRSLMRGTLPRFDLSRLALQVVPALALGGLLVLPVTMSFIGNRRLQRSVGAAMAAAAALPESMTAIPSGGDLARLDSLRDQVEVLSRHVHDGPPFWLRWGLYSGERMYPPARALYFDKFARVLYDSTRVGLRRATSGLTLPNAGIPYDSAYRLLRAYLVTTDEHERSTPEFVGPALENAWPQRSAVDSATRRLAGRQFEFFGSELPYGNPFADRGDASLIGSARAVLAKSSGITPIYIAMLTEASRRGRPVRLGAPGAGALINQVEVPAQFTKSGWRYFVDTALTGDLDRFLQGEPWVTGGIIRPPADRNGLARELRKRYTDDYIGAWRRYVSSANIAGFANLEYAAQRIDVLAGPTLPLLRMLLTVSENAVVDSGVRAALQPVEIVMPLENKDNYIGGANQEYMDQLGALATAVHQVADVPPGADASGQLQQASTAAGGVRGAVGKLSRRFASEPERQLALTRLLLMPAERLERVIQMEIVGKQKAGDASAINAAAAAFCAETREVLGKFPFARAQAQATGAELAKLFKPAGTIAQFYQQALAGKVLARTGAGYRAVPGGPTPTDQLLRFMNSAQRITDALFPGGAAEPRVQFTLRPQLTESIPILTMTFGDETFQFARGGERTVTPSWRFKDDDGVEFSRRGSGRSRDNGPWAPFRMYWDDAKPGAVAGTKIYDIILGQARTTLEMAVGGGLSDPAFFAGLICPVQAVR